MKNEDYLSFPFVEGFIENEKVIDTGTYSLFPENTILQNWSMKFFLQIVFLSRSEIPQHTCLYEARMMIGNIWLLYNSTMRGDKNLRLYLIRAQKTAGYDLSNEIIVHKLFV